MKNENIINVEHEVVQNELSTSEHNGLKISKTSNLKLAEYKEMQEHNEKVIKDLPMLKDSILLTVGNQFFRPKPYDVPEERIDILKRDFPDLKIDDQNMLQTPITVDDKPIILHQHISGLLQVDKSYTPYNVVNFNFNTVKELFENKIPLVFKQSVVLLAYSNSDPDILSLGFEEEELQEVTHYLKLELDKPKKLL